MRLPLHTQVEDFEVRDDCLVIGGRPLTEIADQVGSTPFYCYSADLIRKRISHLRTALPSAIDVHYAIKANPMQAIVDLVASLVDGLDVASAGELKNALASGISADVVSFAGPGKTLDELHDAVSAGVLLNVESRGELLRLVKVGTEQGKRPRVAIRVNPDFELKSSGMKMGGGPKQFGIDAELVPAILREIAALDLDFEGFHIFSGSQNLRSEAIVESQAKSIDLVYRLSADAPVAPKIINIGGGFGIPYFPGDKPLELAPIGDHLADLVEDVARELPGAQLVIELGRYIVGEAGIYVCRVIDRKVSRGEVFLVADGGMHHHLAASGNFGQVLRKNYPVLIGNKVFGESNEKVNVVGPLCTPLDLLADKMTVSVAGEGDLIVVFQSGAYGLSASPSGFLSHLPAQEVLV